MSAEVLSRGAWSLDVGLTGHREGILAAGWETKAAGLDVGLQAGILADLSTNPAPTWWAGGTVRF